MRSPIKCATKAGSSLGSLFIIGLNQDGYKELLGMYIGENEVAKFWLQVLTDLITGE